MSMSRIGPPQDFTRADKKKEEEKRSLAANLKYIYIYISLPLACHYHLGGKQGLGRKKTGYLNQVEHFRTIIRQKKAEEESIKVKEE